MKTLDLKGKTELVDRFDAQIIDLQEKKLFVLKNIMEEHPKEISEVAKVSYNEIIMLLEIDHDTPDTLVLTNCNCHE